MPRPEGLSGDAAPHLEDDGNRPTLNNPLLLSYYGDDLTGSTDVMEALSSRGVPTVLFTQAPTADQRARFPAVRAVGIAGTSRSETPAWMDAHLAPAFAALKDFGAAVTHYKVCSTFDFEPDGRQHRPGG